MLRMEVLLCGLVCGVLKAEVSVTDATVRLLPPGVPNTAAYFSIHNHSETMITLVGAKVDFANKAEIHNHIMVNDMMSMQQQAEVVIQPGATVDFAPGGLHIMLFGLNKPLQEGQTLAISLQTKKGESINMAATIARPSAHSHH